MRERSCPKCTPASLSLHIFFILSLFCHSSSSSSSASWQSFFCVEMGCACSKQHGQRIFPRSISMPISRLSSSFTPRRTASNAPSIKLLQLVQQQENEEKEEEAPSKLASWLDPLDGDVSGSFIKFLSPIKTAVPAFDPDLKNNISSVDCLINMGDSMTTASSSIRRSNSVTIHNVMPPFQQGALRRPLSLRNTVCYEEEEEEEEEEKEEEEEELSPLQALGRLQGGGDQCRRLEEFKYLCPPEGEGRVVLYLTSLRGVRKTFENCCALRLILEGLLLKVHHRDVWMHYAFRQELTHLLSSPSLQVPRLFINGRYIGGVEEVKHLHEEGILADLILEANLSTGQDHQKHNLTKYDTFNNVCEGCGDLRFIPCLTCNGSCKLFIMSEGSKNAPSLTERCPDCNENGLIMCPLCNT